MSAFVEPDWSTLAELPSEEDLQQLVVDQVIAGPVLTNLSPASPMMVLTGIVASQVAKLTGTFRSVVASGFPRYARGGWLDLWAEAFGTGRIEGRATEGLVIATRAAGAGNYTVLAGHAVTTPAGDVRFRVSADTFVPDNTSVQVPIVAVERGAAGNLAAGTLTVLSPPVADLEVANPIGWVMAEGRDGETDAELQRRLDLRWDRLARSATAATYRAWAAEAGAEAAEVITHPRGQGTLDVVIVGPDGIPSPTLIAEVQAYIEERRPLDADVLVRGPSVVTVALSPVLVLHPTEGVAADLELLARDLIVELGNAASGGTGIWRPWRMGEDFRPGRIIAALMTFEAVLDVEGLPAQVTVPAGSILQWGVINVTSRREEAL